MGPIFDAGFSESSFGFRPRRGAHGALRQVQASIKAGYRIAVDLDLAKFFDNVQHDILMARVARKVGDARLLGLIGRYLRAGAIVGETFEPSEIGTPQGGPLSPLRRAGAGQDAASRRAGEGEPHGVSHQEAQASGQ
jgi:RNA-directed DNA polymerase